MSSIEHQEAFIQYFGNRWPQRLERMKAGASELQQWLIDLTRNGIASLSQSSDQFWEQISTRMVDQQLGGVANQINQLKQMIQQDEENTSISSVLAQLSMIATGFSNWETLVPKLQMELAQLGGAKVKQEAVLNQKGIQDDWLVMAQSFSLFDQLTARSVWLLGSKTNRKALILNYTFGNQPFPDHYEVGMAFEGEVAFFPGAIPVRGLLKHKKALNHAYSLPPYIKDFQEVKTRMAKAIAISPWLSQIPCLIGGITPLIADKKSILLDRKKKQVMASPSIEKQFWKLLAVSGNQPINLFGEWDGNYFLPLTMIYQSRLISLSSNR